MSMVIEIVRFRLFNVLYPTQHLLKRLVVCHFLYLNFFLDFFIFRQAWIISLT